MAKRNQAVKSQQKKQKQQKNRAAIVTEQAYGQAPVTKLPGSLMTAAHSSMQLQATGLSDRRFQTAQRQVMASQIGRVGGNQHLQRVIAQVKEPEQRESAPVATRRPSPAPFVSAVRGAVVQRDKSKPDPKAKKPSFDRAAIETIKTNAERRHESITNFIRESRGTLQIYKSRLLEAATVYKAAFSRHKAVLDEAKEAAADRKQMISTIAGFAVGVTLGVPGAVARIGLKTLAARAATAFSVGAELTELAVGAGAGWVSGGPDAKAFEPTADIPEVKELAVWRTLAEMSDKLLSISLLTAKQMKIVSAAGTAITEIRLREGGAKNLEKTDAELQALVDALKSADEASGEVSLGLQDAKAEIDELGAKPARHMTVDEVEQDIWIEWIADLTDDDLLDEDDITDHLEDLGVIGKGRKFWDEEYGEWRREPPRLDVDFGSWVSDEDEEDAVNAARAKLGRQAPVSSGGAYYDEE